MRKIPVTIYDEEEAEPNHRSMPLLAEKIIGVVILLFIATIVSGVLAFEVVFVWTYHPQPQTYMQPQPLSTGEGQ